MKEKHFWVVIGALVLIMFISLAFIPDGTHNELEVANQTLAERVKQLEAENETLKQEIIKCEEEIETLSKAIKILTESSDDINNKKEK